METMLFFTLILLSLSSSSIGFAASTVSFWNAADVLSDSGYLSMALTLRTTSKSLNLQSSTATIFAPSDAAFAQFGQPPLLLLQYHILPIRLSLDAVKTFPCATRIPTILSNYSLVVTNSSGFDSSPWINNVKIDDSAIFDDGSLVIYGINDFFDSTFELACVPPSEPTNERNGSVGVSFGLASDLLRSRGCSVMATFLDVQLGEFTNQTRLTIFAPVDEAVVEYTKNVTHYSTIFLRHVVPRLLPQRDLNNLDDETKLQTFSQGFMINVTRSGGVLLLNGVPVIFPDMYNSNWLVVHGVNRLLVFSGKYDSIGVSFSELETVDEQEQSDYAEDDAP